MVAAATTTSRGAFRVARPFPGVVMVPRTERQMQSRGPRPGEASPPPTAASAHTGRAPRPPFPQRGLEPTCGLPRRPGPASGSSSIALATSRVPLRRRRSGLRSGGRCCSPSRPRRCCRGRRARIWREPRRPPRPTRRLGDAASRGLLGKRERGEHHRENRSFHSFAGSPIDIPAEGTGLPHGGLPLTGSGCPAIGDG